MSPRLVPMRSALAALAASSLLFAQAPHRAHCEAAAGHALSTETGGFLLSIPGVADDFVLFADGQWLVRPDGSAHLSAYAQRTGAFDRDLFVELDFRNRIEPGNASYPPSGSPVATMLPQAYAPLGTVDPSAWTYYTQVSGTITGLRAYQGLRAVVSNVGNAQLGPGATNKNLQSGVAVDLQIQTLQPSQADLFQPTGAMSLRANFVDVAERCAMHVAEDALLAGASDRLGMTIPGLGEYVFTPRGDFREFATGQAWLLGTLRHRTDFDDAWDLRLTLDQVVDPGTTNHPPHGGGATGLLGTAYRSQGGPVDPNTWRYYVSTTGLLTGLGNNEGGILNLSGSAPTQLGIGAGQGNSHFGITATMQPTVNMQPFARSIQVTGDVTLHANLTKTCIQPAPIITHGGGQSIETVTNDRLVFKGVDLGFIEQGAIDWSIVGNDDRRWFQGFVRVLDHQTVELSIPQGMAPGSHALRLLNATRPSNQVQITLDAPVKVTMKTETDRLPGEVQHFVTHQGAVQGFAFCFMILSTSHQPSNAAGVLDLEIGNQFTDYAYLDYAVHDGVSSTSVITLPVPSTLQGAKVYAQAALMDQTFFPLIPSNSAKTTY